VKNIEKTFIIVVCGPTASGKTALAVNLAEIFDGEIIGADSMQIYKGMDIATAKPTCEELRGIKHHLIDFLEPYETFSVADYVDLARKTIGEVAGRGKLPIIAGGTGLYIDSLVNNIEFSEIKADEKFRNRMKILAEEKGAAYLLDELRQKDPETAETLHENNVKRVIRALEVLQVTGRSMSELKRESRLNSSPYEPLFLQIDFPRNKLYERIDLRVDEMLKAGLLEEARAFYAGANSSTSVQAIGYKELLPYLKNQAELSQCAENLKKVTRNYAKRQITWFKKEPRINYLTAEEANQGDFLELITKKAEDLIRLLTSV
jgi:tRNA dimethylallyltransferase